MRPVTGSVTRALARCPGIAFTVGKTSPGTRTSEISAQVGYVPTFL